jgi:hypothetical protein
MDMALALETNAKFGTVTVVEKLSVQFQGFVKNLG